jgi:hypothetical protein
MFPLMTRISARARNLDVREDRVFFSADVCIELGNSPPIVRQIRYSMDLIDGRLSIPTGANDFDVLSSDVWSIFGRELTRVPPMYDAIANAIYGAAREAWEAYTNRYKQGE